MARSLLPREHGSYFQLAIPLVGVWVRIGASATAAALTIAAVGAFLALEPLSVAIGGRGARIRASEGPRARLRFVALAIPALACGAFGLARAPAATLIVAAALALVTLGVIVLVARRTVHTLSGELLAMIGLTGASAVVATASGVALVPALERWGAWALGFGATMIAIHQLFERRTRKAPTINPVVVALVVIAAVVPATHAALPLTIAAVVIAGIAPSLRQIRMVGIAIAVVALTSALLPW
ncbi:MAG TPA: YwiC-like family protein [Kofleriaceae bacterium]|nr:YwiC-like family protein [Kofleriaceae bacterium]